MFRQPRVNFGVQVASPVGLAQVRHALAAQSKDSSVLRSGGMVSANGQKSPGTDPRLDRPGHTQEGVVALKLHDYSRPNRRWSVAELPVDARRA